MGNMSMFVVWMFITRSCQREISFLTLRKSKQTNWTHASKLMCVLNTRCVYMIVCCFFTNTINAMPALTHIFHFSLLLLFVSILYYFLFVFGGWGLCYVWKWYELNYSQVNTYPGQYLRVKFVFSLSIDRFKDSRHKFFFLSVVQRLFNWILSTTKKFVSMCKKSKFSFNENAHQQLDEMIWNERWLFCQWKSKCAHDLGWCVSMCLQK